MYACVSFQLVSIVVSIVYWTMTCKLLINCLCVTITRSISRVPVAVIMITVGHRTISGRISHVADHSRDCMDKMTDQSSSTTFVDDSCSSSTDSTLYKRPCLPVSEEQHPRKKRLVTMTTTEKWIAENDKTLNTTSWLQYEVIDRSYVSSLKCSMRAQFEDQLDGVRNFNRVFIEGSKNLRASAFKDHA